MTSVCACSPEDDDWCPSCDAAQIIDRAFSRAKPIDPRGSINDPGDAGDFEEWCHGH